MKNMELDILEAALDGPLKKGTRGKKSCYPSTVMLVMRRAMPGN